MFIELADLLRCPADHTEGQLVVATGEMSGRTIVRGLIGCPKCHAEFRVEQGIVRFGPVERPAETGTVPEVSALHAFLGLTNPGGYVALVGSPARVGDQLSALLGGVRVVGVNAPTDVSRAPMLSLLESTSTIPLRTGSMRGVVLGGELVSEPWLSEAVRVVLPGLRVVVLSDRGEMPGVEKMVTGPGVWVGRKGDKRRGTRDE